MCCKELLITTKTQSKLQGPITKQESASKQCQLFFRTCHRKEGRTHQQRSKESKGNLKLQYLEKYQFAYYEGSIYSISWKKLNKARFQALAQYFYLCLAREKHWPSSAPPIWQAQPLELTLLFWPMVFATPSLRVTGVFVVVLRALVLFASINSLWRKAGGIHTLIRRMDRDSR